MRKKMKSICFVGMVMFVMVACGTGKETEPMEEEKKEVIEQIIEEAETELDHPEAAPMEENDPEMTEIEETEVVEEQDGYEVVLEKYRQALKEEWDPGKLMEEDLSILLSYCYEGDPMKNVGFYRLDLDGNGTEELLIGEIAGDDFVDGMLFDVYSLVDGSLIHLLSGAERDRYFLIEEEAGGYHVANEASAGAGNCGWFYANLLDNEWNIHQAIIYNESETGENWYMTYAKEWDIDEAERIEKDLAEAIIDSHTNHYMELPYIPMGE